MRLLVINWFDWTLLETHADLLRFFKKMVAFRAAHPTLRRGRYFTGQPDEHGVKDVEWHGTALESHAWDDPNGRALAFPPRGQGLDIDDIQRQLRALACHEPETISRLTHATANRLLRVLTASSDQEKTLH